MQFQLSGLHLEVTPALREHVETRLGRLTRLDDQLLGLTVVLSVDKLEQRARGTLKISGATLHAEAAEADMYASIDILFEKLVSQLRRHHKKISDRHQIKSPQEHQYG